MFRKSFLFIVFLLISLILSGCKPNADMTNPASTYCEEQGGTLEIREDPTTGGQVGYCLFADGSECEEWAFFRDECKPGDSLSEIANMPNPASVYCEENGGTLEIRTDEATGGQVGYCLFADGSECEEWAYFRGECQIGNAYPVNQLADDGWKIYENHVLGYNFHFPPDAKVILGDDPDQTITIQGPLVDDENWPMIFFNHPGDRPDYLVPEGVDLVDWLSQNNLLMEERLPDRIIAGEQAIHFRQETSEQAYPSDQFFFVKNGQLFNIVILHTGYKEDWDVYNQFLDSIQFNG